MARKPTNLDAMREREPVLAPEFAEFDDGSGGDGRPPLLPQPCPVTPLGVRGNRLIFLDRMQQVAIATPNQVEKGHLKLWFGDGWLVGHYPSYNAKGEPDGKFNQDKVQTALIEDCEARGIFNPNGAVFGRGAHRFPGDEQQLVLHMGRRVLLANTANGTGGRMKEPQLRKAGAVTGGLGEAAFFPALESLPAPAETAATVEECRTMFAVLRRWAWVEEDASVLLLGGFIGQMFFCGALNWRSHIWLAGPTASGKTSLQKFIRALLGKWCLFTEDASEAALRQTLGDDTLAVMVDEAEAHDRPERLQGILNLMKKASSGAKIHRGGQDHKATEFTAQSCFLLSSVLHASMRGEDRNRIAILEMRAIAHDAPPLELELAIWAGLGRRMHRRMIEQWPRFDQTLDDYKSAIAKLGFEGRWRDTYGTLLACADLLLFDTETRAITPNEDDLGPARVGQLAAMIVPAMERGRVEARSDVERVIVHMLSHMLPGAHGKPPEPIGVWLDRAMTLKEVAAGQSPTDGTDLVVDKEARDKLKSHGLRVVKVSETDNGKPSISDAMPEEWQTQWLAVAYPTNKALCDVFRGSEWADGGWLQSLGKIPCARKPVKVRFASADNAVLVPLSVFRSDEG